MNSQFTPTFLPKNSTDMKDMISFRQLLVLVFSGAFFVSCAPYPPEGPYAAPILNAERVEDTQTEAEQIFQTEIEKQKDANRKRLEAKKVQDAGRLKRAAGPWREGHVEREANGNTTEIVKKKDPAPVRKKSKYPIAKLSREGFVINPYTGKEVDVRGIPGGRLVVDPDDPNRATNKFRVP